MSNTILFNPKIKKIFKNFLENDKKFALGICNGCQLMAKLGWIDGIKDLELIIIGTKENKQQKNVV